LRENVLLNFDGLGISGEFGGCVMDRREEVEGDEFTEMVIMFKSGGGGDEEDIVGAVGFACVELGQDGDEEFRYGEGEEYFDEFVFPGSLEPGLGVGGRSRTNVEIVEEEETVDNCGVVEADGRDGGLGMIAMVGETSVLDRHKHDVHEDGCHIRKDINNPFVCGGGRSGGVGLKEIEYVGEGIGDFNVLDDEVGGFALEGSLAGGKGVRGHC
jgi:hypothetical protein